MASTINAKNTSTGVVITPDASGQLELQTADTTRMTITSGGNVGIGTSSPTSALVVSGAISGSPTVDGVHLGTLSGYAAIELCGTSGTGSVVDFTKSGSDNLGRILYDNTNNYMAINTNSLERMRIDGNGDVLINTTSQATNYGGRMNLWGNYTAQWGLSMNSTSGTGTQFYIAFIRNNSGSAAGTISSTATNSTTYATTSDYRLKENVTPMTGALDKVALLNPVTYTWKEDGSSGQGFIAHELQAVVPECVVGEKDEVREDGTPVYQGVDTSFLVATLTAAIKELKAELDSVKAELATLKGTA